MALLSSHVFKVSGRHNPETNQPGWYYRLVESYRNCDGRVCHRAMLNLAFLEGLSPEQMNSIQKILTERTDNHGKSLFNALLGDDPIVNLYVEVYYTRLVSEKNRCGTCQNIQTGKRLANH